jgi:hypothetical protein
MAKEGKKKEALARIFEHVQAKTKAGQPLVFHNDLVKQLTGTDFGNQFDVTKIDNSEKLPDVLREHDYFLVHLGGGRHQFVKGIANGFHAFEPIPPERVHQWCYCKSLLNELDTSEASMLSLVFNQRILHHFLFDDVAVSPKIYLARRTKFGFTYHVGTTEITTESVQMEIDMVTEHRGVITVFEGKNGDPKDFAVYQLYHPFRYYCHLVDRHGLDVKEINCAYVLRQVQADVTTIKFYLYAFTSVNRPTSIVLRKNAQYTLETG